MEIKGVALTGLDRKDFSVFFNEPSGDEEFLQTQYVSLNLNFAGFLVI
jgi:hypothetical protein